MSMPDSHKELLVQLRVEIRQSLQIDRTYFLDYTRQCSLFTPDQLERFKNVYHPQSERVGELINDLEKSSAKALSKFCLCLERDNQDVLLERIRLKAQELGIPKEEVDSLTVREQLYECARLKEEPIVGKQMVKPVKIDRLAAVLKETYIHKMNIMTEVQFEHFDSPNIKFYDLYTQLQLMTKSPKGGEMELEKLKDHESILAPRKKEKRPRFTLMEGAAGIGKTTTLRNLLLIWCNLLWLQKLFRIHILSKFKLVVFIPLRSVPPGSTLASYIQSQIPLECQITEKEIKATIEQNSSQILFLLDGWDEFHHNSAEIDQILSGNYLQSSTKILSTRPTHLPRHAQFPHDRMITISGFSKEGQERYIMKYFQQSLMKAKAFLKEIEIKELQAVSRVPFLLMVMCALYKHSETLSTSQAGLYRQLLEFMHRRQKEKMPDISNIKEILKGLGKLAILNLLGGDLEFTVQEDNKHAKDALMIGILQRIYTFSEKNQGEILTSFYHKTIHEYVCGQYVCTCTDDEFHDILEYLYDAEKPAEIYNITKFCEEEEKTEKSEVIDVIKERSSFLQNYMIEMVVDIYNIKTMEDALLFNNVLSRKTWNEQVIQSHSMRQPAFSSQSVVGMLLRYSTLDYQLWAEEKKWATQPDQQQASPFCLNINCEASDTEIFLSLNEDKMLRIFDNIHGSLHTRINVSRLTSVRLFAITLDEHILCLVLKPPRKILDLDHVKVTPASLPSSPYLHTSPSSLTHVAISTVQGGKSAWVLLAEALISSVETLHYICVEQTELDGCEFIFTDAKPPVRMTHVRLWDTNPVVWSWVGKGYMGSGRMRKWKGPWEPVQGGPGHLKRYMEYESDGHVKLQDLPLPDTVFNTGSEQGRSYTKSRHKEKKTKEQQSSESSGGFMEADIARLERIVNTRNLTFRYLTPADGNCFFHAVADQLERLRLCQISHKDLRQMVADHLRQNPFVEDMDQSYSSWSTYVDNIAKEGVYVDKVVIRTMASLLKRNLCIISVNPDSEEASQQIIKSGSGLDDPPLLLGHIHENHYQSLTDGD